MGRRKKGRNRVKVRSLMERRAARDIYREGKVGVEKERDKKRVVYSSCSLTKPIDRHPRLIGFE